MTIRILTAPISRAELQGIADERFGDLVKAAVDVEHEVIALGSELHADAEAELMEKEDARREHIWGINLYPAEHGERFLEFDSMINLKPASGNRTRGVEDAGVRERIRSIVEKFIVE